MKSSRSSSEEGEKSHLSQEHNENSDKQSGYRILSKKSSFDCMTNRTGVNALHNLHII